MPIGTPDFNQNVSTNETAPSYDNAENTTRLLMGGGSQARSGRWIFATGFEEGASPYFISTASGTGGVVGITGVQTFQGVGAYELKAGTAVNNWAYFNKEFIYPGSKFGIEFFFSKQYALDSDFEIVIQGGHKGVNQDKFRKAKIVFEITTPGLFWKIYKDVNGVRTFLFDATNYMGTQYLWHYFKLVYNIKDNIIDYIIFDDIRIEINSPGYEFTSTSIYSTSFEVRVTNKHAGVNPYYFIDNLVLTADEP